MKQEQSANRTCTFFGHRDCPASLSSELENAIAELIETDNVSNFYVGNDGSYDMMVRHALAKIKQRYPHIRYCVVLAYLPAQNAPFGKSGFSDTLYPEGIELVPKRYAISWRNKWMLDRSTHVITYVNYSWGGAAQFAQMAKRQKKIVRNLGTL